MVVTQRQGPDLLLGRQHLHARAPPRTPSRSTSASTRTRRGSPSRTRPRHSGLKSLAAVNGACAGGGYELALACDEILLVDDARSAVSLPEVSLLGVLPGHGRPHARRGQAQGAPRPRRRLLEPRRGREGQARGAVAARGRDGSALAVRGSRPREGARRWPSARPRRRDRASTLAPLGGRYSDEGVEHRYVSRSGSTPRSAWRGLTRARPRRRTSPATAAAMRERGSGAVGPARLPRAGRRRSSTCASTGRRSASSSSDARATPSASSPWTPPSTKARTTGS